MLNNGGQTPAKISMMINENFQDVIAKHTGIIYKVANAYCKDNEDRKDLVQEIIIQLWNSFSKYNPKYSRSTWIYGIALNVSISFYRKDTRRKVISMPLTDDIRQYSKEDEPDDKERDLGLLKQFFNRIKRI